MRVLILGSDSLRTPDRPPLPHGLIEFRESIERRCDVQLALQTSVKLRDFKRVVRESRADAVLLLPHWDQSPPIVEAVLQDLFSMPGRPRLVLLDQVDQSCSPFFAMAAHVDHIVKSQVLADAGAYTLDQRSGYVFADFLADSLGFDLAGWSFGTRIDPRFLCRLHVGWNLGVSRRVRRLVRLGRISPLPWRARPYDLHCRLGTAAENDVGWYASYRRFAGVRLAEATRGSRSTGSTRVSTTRYLMEMALSRIVFSPFGWGEVCYRDYEAVALGALLVKPSMDHLVTSPNIFVPNETYVPVRWDLSDLAEKCAWCLSHPAESSRIVDNARRVLGNYFEAGGFSNDVGRVLKLISAN
jgi:hypothetical protein